MISAKQEAMIWLNKVLGSKIDAAISGTAVSRNLLIAIAIQETFYIWRNIYKTGTLQDVLNSAVGDVIDAPSRTVFPLNRLDLENWPQGKEMFKIARAELEVLAKINFGYRKSVLNPDKFCRGYGLFQYDIQEFKNDPEFFLQKKWKSADAVVAKCVEELKSKILVLKFQKKKSLSFDETVYLGIAYNRGSAKLDITDPELKFKQGHHEKGDPKYYGDYIAENLKLMNGLW